MPYKVVILIEDFHTDYDIIRDIATHKQEATPTLTAYESSHTDEPPFKHGIYGLFETNIGRANGIIAIINYNTLKKNPERFYIRLNTIEIPLLIIIQNCPLEYSTEYFCSIDCKTIYIPDAVYPRIKGCYAAIHLWLVRSMEDTPPSEPISNKILMKLFETDRIQSDTWNHYCRLRLIFISLRYYGYSETIKFDGWLCTHWRNFHHETWNYSLIRLWTDEILRCINEFNDTPCKFKTLYCNNHRLNDAKLHVQYYTSDILHIRDTYVPPNKRPDCTIS
jgi:hypothetical protein